MLEKNKIDIFEMIKVVELLPSGGDRISSVDLLHGLGGSRAGGYVIIHKARVLGLLSTVGYLEPQDGRGAPCRLYALTELGRQLRVEDAPKLREIYKKYGVAMA